VKTKLQKVAEEIIFKLEKFAKENAQSDAYHFEKRDWTDLKSRQPSIHAGCCCGNRNTDSAS
jgi:hypothetical protein